MNPRAGFARQTERDRLVDQTRADRDSIGCVCFRAVALGDGRGDAALCPRGRRALAQGRRRNHRDRTRR